MSNSCKDVSVLNTCGILPFFIFYVLQRYQDGEFICQPLKDAGSSSKLRADLLDVHTETLISASAFSKD